MHANPPASGGPSLPEAPVYQMKSSPTQPTWAIRNVLQLDIVSTKRLNIILYKRQRGCKEEENSLLTELEDKLRISYLCQTACLRAHCPSSGTGGEAAVCSSDSLHLRAQPDAPYAHEGFQNRNRMMQKKRRCKRNI